MDLVASSKRDGRPVFALSFHVDYWNRLGWKDPYSAAAWSERQRIYSNSTGDNVYTPQCVVNGTHSFTGSDRNELDKRVREALSGSALIGINATMTTSGSAIQVGYELKGDVEGKELVACLVESSVSSQVTRGENTGRKLLHNHVVRDLRSLSLTTANETGSFSFALEQMNDPAQGEVILFLQERHQGRILAATSVPLPEI